MNFLHGYSTCSSLLYNVEPNFILTQTIMYCKDNIPIRIGREIELLGTGFSYSFWSMFLDDNSILST